MKRLILISGVLSVGVGLVFAGTAEWRQARERARAAVKQSRFEDAAAEYWNAVTEGDNAFKGADMRLLETVLEAADFYTRQREYATARQILETGLTRLEKPKPGESLYKAALLVALGDVSLFSSQPDEADKAYQDGLRIIRDAKGSRHPIAARALNGLASVAVERKDESRALTLLEEALAIAPSPELDRFEANALSSMGLCRVDPDLEAKIQNSIANLYAKQQKLADAEKWYRDALKTIERTHVAKSPRLSVVLQNLARVHKQAQNFAQARDALLRALP